MTNHQDKRFTKYILVLYPVAASLARLGCSDLASGRFVHGDNRLKGWAQ